MQTAKERKKKIVDKVRAKRGGIHNRTATSKVDVGVIARRQARVADLHRQSYTHREIVAKLAEEGIVTSQSTVSKDIGEMIVQLTDSQLDDTEKWRKEQLERLAYVVRTCWAEFEFSRTRTITIKPNKNDKDQTVRTEVVRTEGNLEWLKIIGDMMDREAKLTGTVRQNITNNNLLVNQDGPLQINWNELSKSPSHDPIKAKIEEIQNQPLLREAEVKDVGTES